MLGYSYYHQIHLLEHIKLNSLLAEENYPSKLNPIEAGHAPTHGANQPRMRRRPSLSDTSRHHEKLTLQAGAGGSQSKLTRESPGNHWKPF